MRRINVGVSILPTAAADTWNASLNQNIAFMTQLLARVPSVAKVFLLNGGDADRLPEWPAQEPLAAPLVRPQEITHEIDLVIEMGATLPLEWLRHVRALGARIVTLFAGHTYAGQIETPMFERPGGAPFGPTPWHEIWTLPHHMKTSAPMLATIGRVPVHEVPHIWSPSLLQAQADQQARAGHRFGFAPAERRGQPWRLAIFEPNASVVRTSFIPMLLCDQAYRRNRDAIGFMMVTNTFFMKGHPTFNRLATHLDLTRDSKASYEPWVGFADCMAGQRMDAVVSHQWECGLDYTYYEALHGGYPLVHNSPFLHDEGVGLYYADFEADRGAQVLLEAWAQEPAFWDDYGVRAAAFVGKLAPHAPANVEAYARRIDALMENTR